MLHEMKSTFSKVFVFLQVCCQEHDSHLSSARQRCAIDGYGHVSRLLTIALQHIESVKPTRHFRLCTRFPTATCVFAGLCFGSLDYHPILMLRFQFIQDSFSCLLMRRNTHIGMPTCPTQVESTLHFTLDKHR